MSGDVEWAVQLHHTDRIIAAIMPNRPQTPDEHPRRYPATRTAPWFFLILAVLTVLFIVSGVLGFDPVTRFLRWLAVVL